MQIEIVLPILNEESTLQKQVIYLRDYLNRDNSQKHQFKITIADNGSNDCSEEIGVRLSQLVEDVSYIRLDKRGVGLALKAAWANSSADIIGFMDLDFATKLEHLDDVWRLLETESYDLVCGSRNLPNSIVTNRKPSRTVTSLVLNKIIKRVFDTKFSDGMCGFKFMRRGCLAPILNNGVGFDGWFFSSELLIVSEFLDFSICDLAVQWEDNRETKVKVAKLSLEYLMDIYRLKTHLISLSKANADYRQAN